MNPEEPTGGCVKPEKLEDGIGIRTGGAYPAGAGVGADECAIDG